jgi:cell cycle protein kinase DBF2
MDTRAGKSSAVVGLPDVLMATLSNDTITETSRPGTTFKNGRFQLWERELLESSEVRRKSTVAQLCTCYRARTQYYMLTPPLRFP